VHNQARAQRIVVLLICMYSRVWRSCSEKEEEPVGASKNVPLLINDHRDKAETDDQIHSKVVHRAGDWTRRVYGVYWIVISPCIPLQRKGQAMAASVVRETR
jgi:hypothetical protein